MERKIKQHTTLGKPHGYWENNMDSSYKLHWFYGLLIGYYERLIPDGNILLKCHYTDYKKIGCEQYRNSQYYFKTPAKKFGEQIAW